MNKTGLEGIRRFHQHGIKTASGAIVGFDHDGLSIFRKHLEFFMQSGISVVKVGPLQVLDGTRLEERMVEEGRYVDWEHCDGDGPHVLNGLESISFVPKQMTAEQLKQGIYWLLWRLYEPENFVERYRLFFEHYEDSRVKDTLEIPKGRQDRGMPGFVGRFLGFLITDCSPSERGAFQKMLGYTMQSDHPRRLVMLVVDFLEFMNTRQKLRTWCPGIDQVEYPRC